MDKYEKFLTWFEATVQRIIRRNKKINRLSRRSLSSLSLSIIINGPHIESIAPPFSNTSKVMRDSYFS